MVLVFLERPAHSLDLAGRRIIFSGAGGDCSPLCTPAATLISPPAQLRNLELDRTKHRIIQRNKYVPLHRNSQASTTSLMLSRGGAEDSPESLSEHTPGASDVLSYYLLWSPGIFRTTTLCTIALFALRLASFPFQSRLTGMVDASPRSSSLRFVVQVAMLPLLSSACCGIQLAINALVGAGGCAGFNKYLGPLRPYFLSMLFITTASTFPFQQSLTAIVQWFQYALFRWTVALMPEMVHVWNSYVAKRTRQRHEGRDGSAVYNTTIELTIPTMGCVACINKIDSSIRQCAPDQITDAKSWLEPSEMGGKALVRAVASTKEEAESLANTVAKSVQAAGFEPCFVDSVHTREP